MHDTRLGPFRVVHRLTEHLIKHGTLSPSHIVSDREGNAPCPRGQVFTLTEYSVQSPILTRSNRSRCTSTLAKVRDSATCSALSTLCSAGMDVELKDHDVLVVADCLKKELAAKNPVLSFEMYDAFLNCDGW